jgi:hypothetical protein
VKSERGQILERGLRFLNHRKLRSHEIIDGPLAIVIVDKLCSPTQKWIGSYW